KKLPKDVRTIMKSLKLDAKLQHYICCQSCYSLYDIEFAPSECTYQATVKSSPCGVDLFEPLNQLSIENVYTIFQNKNGIEKNRIHPKKPISIFWPQGLVTNSADVVNHCNSAAWSSLNSDMCRNDNSLCLSFSLFVDWFNPLENKLSGKQKLLQILALTCLNLPPSKQNEHQYTFIAGIIPEPNQPNMITINNVLKPFVEDLLELNKPKKIRTHQFPLGRTVVICLGALIGDIVATHKVAGFSSHSATKLCSWCNINKSNMSQMKISHPQRKEDTLEFAYRWYSEELNRCE
ncbi:hypothetical protein O181_123196, partial [Austropuccinia psidii MF-1]|nr:hypothetical protein [Austropuccinia psidii MF-1]